MKPSGRAASIDVGRVRVGIAVCDPGGILATPLATVLRQDSLQESVQVVLDQIAEFSITRFYVGLPLNLDGSNSSSANDAREFAAGLQAAVAVPVRLVDERLTSTSAGATLRAAGRDSRSQREVIDQVAAVLILEHALAIEARTEDFAGIDLQGESLE